jgi:hypothetical protein
MIDGGRVKQKELPTGEVAVPPIRLQAQKNNEAAYLAGG